METSRREGIGVIHDPKAAADILTHALTLSENNKNSNELLRFQGTVLLPLSNKRQQRELNDGLPVEALQDDGASEHYISPEYISQLKRAGAKLEVR